MSKAPGRNNPKCLDCKHDVRLQHHSTFANTDRDGWELGLCVRCTKLLRRETGDKTLTVICPSVVKFFSKERPRKNFEEEWKEFKDEAT